VYSLSPLRIFLLRHGDADAEQPEGLGDEGRALTTKARLVLISQLTSLSHRMEGVGLILTSPLVRTVQTAQILSFVLNYEGPLRAHRSLLPDMPVGTLESELNAHMEDDVAIVGHQPSMGALAAHLLGLPTFPKPVPPGTVIGLDRALDSADGEIHTSLLFYAAPGQPVLEQLG